MSGNDAVQASQTQAATTASVSPVWYLGVQWWGTADKREQKTQSFKLGKIITLANVSKMGGFSFPAKAAAQVHVNEALKAPREARRQAALGKALPNQTQRKWGSWFASQLQAPLYVLWCYRQQTHSAGKQFSSIFTLGLAWTETCLCPVFILVLFPLWRGGRGDLRGHSHLPSLSCTTGVQSKPRAGTWCWPYHPSPCPFWLVQRFKDFSKVWETWILFT